MLHQIKKLGIIGIMTLLPLPLFAHTVGSIRAEALSTDTSATTTYTFGLVVESEVASGTTLTIAMQRANDTAMNSGYNFDAASFGSEDITAVGSTSSSGSWAYELYLTAPLAANTSETPYIFELSDVVNTATAGCYQQVATPGVLGETEDVTVSEEFIGIGGTDCSNESGDGEEEDSTNFVVTSVGTNIIFDWEPYDGVTTYNVMLDNDDDPSNGMAFSQSGLTETSYVFTDLDAEATYIALINGSDELGELVVIPYESQTLTTGKVLSSTRFTTPTVTKIKKTKATVTWNEPDAAAYVNKYIVEVRKNNKKQQLIKSYKNLSSTAVQRLFKKLNSNTKYKTRMKAVYTFNDANQTTKWSAYKRFETK